MNETSFDFISINLPNPKPRSKGVTCVTDVMWTTSMMDDYLNDFEDIIDWVKIQNHRRTISTYDDKWFLKRNKTLAKHNVGSYIGGMVFEMAYVQGKHRQFFEKNLELGFSAIEVSEDSIPDMPPGVRTDIIKEAKSMGLRVFTEIGKKKPVSPMKSDDAIKAVLEDLEAGSEHVILESAETKLLRENNMIDVLPTIAKAVGLENIYFELRRGYNLEQPWMELCEWLVQSLGPEINVMNIKVDECVWVDRIRYPLTTNQNLH